MSKITLKIFRYDPRTGSPSFYQEYSIETKNNDTLLDLLERIKEEQDPTLCFRRSCRHGVCGSCSLLVDTKPIQSCKTSIDSMNLAPGTKLLIEPLDKDHIFRDLVPDDTAFWNAIQKTQPYLVPKNDNTNVLLPSYTTLRTDCIHCTACQALCPAVKYGQNFLGPAALLKLWRMVEDPRDAIRIVRLRTAAQKRSGAFDCARCLVCVAVCPRKLKPYEKIVALQSAVLKSKETRGIPGNRSRHSLGFRFTVLWTGLINEALLGMIILGPRMFRMLPRAFKMLIHGKLVFRIFHPEVQDSKRLRSIQKKNKLGRKI